jgi:hypothetical protein
MREVLAAALIRGSAARKPKRLCRSFDFIDLSLQPMPAGWTGMARRVVATA